MLREAAKVRLSTAFCSFRPPLLPVLDERMTWYFPEGSRLLGEQVTKAGMQERSEKDAQFTWHFPLYCHEGINLCSISAPRPEPNFLFL